MKIELYLINDDREGSSEDCKEKLAVLHQDKTVIVLIGDSDLSRILLHFFIIPVILLKHLHGDDELGIRSLPQLLQPQGYDFFLLRCVKCVSEALLSVALYQHRVLYLDTSTPMRELLVKPIVHVMDCY